MRSLPAIFFVGILACARLGSAPPSLSAPAPVELQGLHNVLRISPQLYSGSGPESDKAFAALAALGVKTIISVDGARPEVEAAKAAGLRYVHVPIGYNRMPRERVVQLAKALQELPGPFYIHCHHGKHRGPAAAAIARLCADERCTVADAAALLRQAGTDPRYVGLFESVEKFVRPSAGELRTIGPLPETVRVAAFTQTMVAIDHHFDNLKRARKAGWKTPEDHPDVDPPHEALQLLEHYQELRRLPALKERPADFQAWLRDGEAAAGELEQVLRQGKKLDERAAERVFLRASAVCTACHAKYRD